jgi:pre-mRNA-processing factor 6
MMLGQLYERCADAAAGATAGAAAGASPDALRARAGEAYRTGLRTCPHALPLWTLAAALEEKAGGASGVARARAVLEAGRLANPRSPLLILAGVRLERRAGADRAADALLARGLQECAGAAAGPLLAEDILTAPRAAQRRKSEAALKRADADAHVVLAVARLFIASRKLDKARKWLLRATTLDADFGDAWAWAAALEAADPDATPAALADVERRAAAADPAHGELWQAVAKSDAGRRCADKVAVLRLAVAHLRAHEAACGLWALAHAAPPTAAPASHAPAEEEK